MTTKLPYSNLAKGTLLIASPEVNNDVYFRTVILLCEHSPNGSFGLIINKPMEMELPEELANFKEMANPRVEIRAGGPMQTNQMMLLHSSPRLDQAMEVCPGVYLGGDIKFLQEAIADSNGPYIRLCFGFSGWGPGILEREFLGGGWFLHPGNSRIVFETPPDKMWQLILREMGGKYATLSMIPEDLSLN